jgi:biopolymer transport protein ExbB/TolQ
MNIGALSNIKPVLFTTHDPVSPNSASAPTTPIPPDAVPASSSNISPTANFLSQLEQLQQQNPAQFSKVASSIATQLQADAKTALSNGNTTQANSLNQLAALFQNSAKSGQVPTVEAFEQAGRSGHHHHHDAASSSSSLLATAVSNALKS